jgi:hypothetical protein
MDSYIVQLSIIKNNCLQYLLQGSKVRELDCYCMFVWHTGKGGALASRRVATGLHVDGSSHSLYMQCVVLNFEERKGYIRVWNSQKI